MATDSGTLQAGILRPSYTFDDGTCVIARPGQITAFADYNADIVYWLGSKLLVGTTVYISLVEGNKGNSPATSPTQWTPIAVTSATTNAGVFSYSATFGAPGSLTIQHNLGVVYPLFVVYCNSGNRRWQYTPIDANSGTFSVDVAGAFQVQFLNTTATTTSGGSGSGGTSGGSIAIPTSGLVEYWPMTEGTGTSCGNSVVTANPLTLSGYAWTPEAGYQSSAACVFNGSAGAGGQAAQVDSASNFDGTTPFSLSIWFTPADITTNKMLISNGRICLLLSNQELQLFLWGGGSWGNGGSIQQHFDTDATNAFTVGTLCNLVLTYDGSQKAAGVAISINGQAKTTNTYGPSQDSYSNTGNCTTGWCVGNYPGANPSLPMNGAEAGAAIYNRVLTASEISQIFSVGAP